MGDTAKPMTLRIGIMFEVISNDAVKTIEVDGLLEMGRTRVVFESRVDDPGRLSRDNNHRKSGRFWRCAEPRQSV